MGAAYVHPSPVEMKYRLSKYIMGKQADCALSANSNTQEDEAVPLLNFQDLTCNDTADNLEGENYHIFYPLNPKTCDVEEQTYEYQHTVSMHDNKINIEEDLLASEAALFLDDDSFCLSFHTRDFEAQTYDDDGMNHFSKLSINKRKKLKNKKCVKYSSFHCKS